MEKIAWLIPLFPLIGFLILGVGFQKISKTIGGWIGCLTILASFILTGILFAGFIDGPKQSSIQSLFNWIDAGSLHIAFSIQIDQLSLIMMMIITGIGFLIHVYSIGYMHDDPGYAKFFSYMNLFVFFMLILVMGSNYVMMFIGWEGVGLCSYLLIGFWNKNHDYNDAAKKAFIMNRIGDLGFLLGIFLMFMTFGSVEFGKVFSEAKSYSGSESTITWITILLFIGAMGKSAQIPLHTWLPDAMAGPTPVSALIHAATMVTAGIYMVARSNILYALAPISMDMILIVGVVTGFIAATVGLYQNDIKKVLAYSTLSQLGFMFAAAGAGAFSTSIFHLMTHAFFKALLFLAAGAVIHSMGGEQDIRKMGGLKKKLPVTWIVFLIGTLAISGLPPFAGFFSKDEILIKVLENSTLAFVILGISSIITAVYMFRLLFLVFLGNFRGTHDQEHHLHESPKIMTVPLMLLALLSAVGGFVGIPALFGTKHYLSNFLQPLMANGLIAENEVSSGTESMIMGVMVIIVIGVIYLAYNYFVKQQRIPENDGVKMPAWKTMIFNKYYFDEIYQTLIVVPANKTGKFFHSVLELKVIDGMVNGIGRLVLWKGSILRYLQNGAIGYYIFAMVFGVIFLLVIQMMLK